MTLIVEDGTGKSDANGYATAAEVTAYFAASGGSAAWTAASSDAKDEAIVRATRYLDGFYGGRFIGLRTSSTQALEWPRANAYDRDGFAHDYAVPAALKAGTAEAALRSLTADLLADGSTEAAVLEEEVAVGPLKTRKKYAGANPSGARSYAAVAKAIDRLVEPPGTVYRA